MPVLRSGREIWEGTVETRTVTEVENDQSNCPHLEGLSEHKKGGVQVYARTATPNDTTTVAMPVCVTSEHDAGARVSEALQLWGRKGAARTPQEVAPLRCAGGSVQTAWW
jgi:hypothetical protein